MPQHKIDLQHALRDARIPSNKKIKSWAKIALSDEKKAREVTLRIVDLAEMTELNQRYRGKTGPTNVLSFPFELPETLASSCLGDIIICPDVVAQEAQAQHKTLEAHFAHLVIHGVLHLLGYDHTHTKDAKRMESKEIELLRPLGFNDPY